MERVVGAEDRGYDAEEAHCEEGHEGYLAGEGDFDFEKERHGYHYDSEVGGGVEDGDDNIVCWTECAVV